MESTIHVQSVETLLKTWMICEATVNLQTSLKSGQKEILHRFKACANTCFDTARDIISKEVEVSTEQILACMIECRSCMEICYANNSNDEIAFCGDVCRQCMQILHEVCINNQLN